MGSKELVKFAPATPALQMDEKELLEVLRNSLYPGANDSSIELVLGYCKAAGLDPMQKPVHIVPMKVKSGKQNQYGDDEYVMRDIIMPGINLYRTQAQDTGQYHGLSEPEFGPVKTLKYKRQEWVDGEGGKRKKTFVEAELEYPEWCRVIAHRRVDTNTGDLVIAFPVVERWLENYATAGRDSTAPNAMWERRPYAQLAKCAKSQALREAFPRVGAQPAAEEMEGKELTEAEGTVIDHVTGEVVKSKVEQPTRKSKVQAIDSSASDAGTTAAAVSPGKAETPVGRAAADETAQGNEEPDTSRKATDGELNWLKAKLDETTLSTVELFKHIGIASLDELTERKFNQAREWIKNPSGSLV